MRTPPLHSRDAKDAEGYRELLGCDVIKSEDSAGWTALLRDLVARRLSGMRLAGLPDHKGLKQAVGLASIGCWR